MIIPEKKEFKLIIAGGRSFGIPSEEEVARLGMTQASILAHRRATSLMALEINKAIEELPDIYVVTLVSGMAQGADSMAWQWARNNMCKVIEMPANWKVHGKRAGFIRNNEMAEMADGLLAFHDGLSKGTMHMIITAENKQLKFIRTVPYGRNGDGVYTINNL